MFGLSQKQLEQIATKCAIWIGLTISLFCILLVIDKILNFDFFPDRLEKVGGVLIGIASIVLVASMFISLMLNVSRIANSIERIADKSDK